MARYARKIGDSWVDVYDAESAAALGNQLGLDPALFTEVASDCQNGDFIVGDSGNDPRPPPPVIDPVPQPGTQEEIINATPTQGYADFKASTDIVAVKNWGLWHARPIFTPAQWDEVADFMETSGFITTAEAETMKSAKPVSGG